MDEKKKILLDLLIALWNDEIWDLARPLAIMISNSKEINEELIEVLLELINKTIWETKDVIAKERLQELKAKLDVMLEQEKSEKKIELEEAENLLNNL